MTYDVESEPHDSCVRTSHIQAANARSERVLDNRLKNLSRDCESRLIIEIDSFFRGMHFA